MKPEELKLYADFMKENQLEYLEVKKGDFQLVLSKNPKTPRTEGNEQKRREEIAPGVKSEEILDEYSHPSQKLSDAVYIKSPIVGTFYRSSSPGSPAFVEKGSSVKKGDTLCIVEAMKVMNEIKSEHDGIIHDILVENANPVEYGQVIFIIKVT